MKPIIAITTGDYNGIGPEVILKSLHQLQPLSFIPVVIGHKKVLSFYQQQLDSPPLQFSPIDDVNAISDERCYLLEMEIEEQIKISPGAITKAAGYVAMKSIHKALELCKQSKANGMVTAPISKEAVNLAGWSIPGHTEFLAGNTDCSNYMMMLVNDDLRVGLVSIHDPLAEVPGKITGHAILTNANVMHRSLQNDFGIDEPKIAILGLNPHAGDGGYIGDEEITTITPAIEQLRTQNIRADGPFAADGFFGNRLFHDYDGILAMYHDQGLVPFKTLSFNAGVNFTAGLPVIRTSPDHGTAFDIAGGNSASPKSFIKALKLAVSLARSRKENQPLRT